MNNEIKEILAYFEKYVKTTYMHDSEPMLNWKDLKIVLDYITNLQQRIEYLERSNNRREDTIMGLKDEIVEYEDYKSRIEKAIPMLKELNVKLKGILNTGIDIKEISDIEDTLNGRSDE